MCDGAVAVDGMCDVDVGLPVQADMPYFRKRMVVAIMLKELLTD